MGNGEDMGKPSDPDISLTERIVRSYEALTPGERQVADHILEHSNEIATLTAAELAERAQVSGPTISRLIRKLGYQHYEACKRAARAIHRSGSSYRLLTTARPASASGHGRLTEHFALEHRALEESMTLINPQTLRELCAALPRARRVWCVGFRNSRVLADYARALLLPMLGNVHAFAGRGETLAESLAAVGRGDLVLAFGMRRRVRQFSTLLGLFHERGADIALMTDKSMRRTHTRARWVIVSATETGQPFDSYTGALATLRLIAIQVLHTQQDAAREHLREVDRLHDRLGELE
jgi:DNA-binding MurR/RpiR family transcriptional regulator